MAKRKDNKRQAEFRRSILEGLKPRLQDYTDYVNVRVDFKDKDHFHVHIIEDYQCHLHVRGEFDEDYVNITSVTNHSVSKDLFDETMDFFRNCY